MQPITTIRELRASGLCLLREDLARRPLDCALLGPKDGHGDVISLFYGIQLLGRPYQEAGDTYVDVRSAIIDAGAGSLSLRFTEDSGVHRRTIKSLGLTNEPSRHVCVLLSELHHVTYATGLMPQREHVLLDASVR